MAEVAQHGEPEGYKEFFIRYKEALAAVGAELHPAKTLGRLVVGLGGEGVLETSLTLHRTYGVPYIPGSALKGLASRFAHLYLEGDAWRRDLAHFERGAAQSVLFGTTEQEGVVVFFDALPEPGSWEIHTDILNPHHPNYNAGGDDPPADWDSPVPVPFLSVKGTFLLALAPAAGVPPKEARPWLEAAWQILEWALREEGIGAKTSSGYGRMQLVREASSAPGGSSGSSSLRPQVEALLVRIRSISYRELTAFLRSNRSTILDLSDYEIAEVRRAFEKRGFQKNVRDLQQASKRDSELKEVLERLGLLG
ncbi:MAG: type III-B CRISPR module RAMP protein Cmr6 [Thermus sp.]|nr:type III-B CRISPR module RAMP protein Cmr6 [Thermus sp.]